MTAVSIEGLLGSGRAAALRLMGDECTITRVASSTFNETTMAYTDTLTEVYAGVCRVKQLNQADIVGDAGERQAVTREYLLSIPTTATAEVGDKVTITSSLFDSTQVGLVLHIVGVGHGSQQTARRLRCQEIIA